MATPPAAGFNLGEFLRRKVFEGLEGRPAPWTTSGQEYDKLRELRGAAIDKKLDDLNRPATTAQQRAADYATEGKALQALSDQALGAEIERRLKFGQGMAGIQGTLQNQETQAIGERTRIGNEAFANRTGVLTQAELQKMDATTRSKRALLDPMLAHESRTQAQQLGFGENLVNSVLGSTERINQMAMQDAERQNSWSNPQNVMGMLGNIALIGSLFV